MGWGSVRWWLISTETAGASYYLVTKMATCLFTKVLLMIRGETTGCFVTKTEIAVWLAVDSTRMEIIVLNFL